MSSNDWFALFGKIVATFGGAGVIVIGISSWIGKILANKMFENQRVENEKYLKDFQYKLDMKMTELNNQLEKSKMKFDLLNKERFDVIRELYAKLTDMEDYVSIYFRSLKSGNETVDEDRKNYILSISDFMNFSNYNRILFDEKIVHDLKEVEALIMIIDKLHIGFIEKKIPIDFNEKDDIYKMTDKLINEEIPKLKRVLEEEFRTLLGVL